MREGEALLLSLPKSPTASSHLSELATAVLEAAKAKGKRGYRQHTMQLSDVLRYFKQDQTAGEAKQTLHYHTYVRHQRPPKRSPLTHGVQGLGV